MLQDAPPVESAEQSKLSILLIEDSPLDAALIRARLEHSNLNFQVKQVSDPNDLEEVLGHDGYDIILSDYNLLGLPGDDILRRARSLCPDTPFVFVSGALGEEKAIELLKCGATDYILKDRLDRLVPSVERALDEARLKEETRRAYAETQQARLRLEGLLALSSGLARAASLEELVREISSHARTFLGTHDVFLATLNGESLQWVREGIDAVSAAALLELGGSSETLFGQGLSPRVDDVEAPSALVPLWGRERQIGLLCLVWDPPKQFVEEDKSVIEALGRHCGQTLERVLASEARALSEERFRSFVEATAQVVWFADGWGQVVAELPEWCAFTGQAPQEILGEGWLSGVHPEDEQRVAGEWAEAVREHVGFESVFRLLHHSGDWRHVQVRAVPVLQADRSVREWVGTMVDVTPAQLARERLEESERRYRQAAESEKVARQQAEQANRLKDEFLATVSHELRTPLTAMLGWVHMLRTAQLPPDKVDQALETVERNARAQAKIIDDLLDVSRILAGKLKIEVETVDLLGVVEQAIETATPAAAARNVHIQTALDSTVRVMGDPHRLGQVIWNLVSNAVKFTPPGGEVCVMLHRRGDGAEIEVKDDGEGIDPDFLPYVFERFRQADGSTTRRQGGLGLGLSIVKHLVELHGGRVAAYSDGRGRGSTFSVSLPLAAVPGTVLGRDQSEPLKVERPQLRGVHLLVVDDEADTRELLRAMLETCNARVSTAASADEALLLLQQEKPDLLISDIGMPGEDGYTLIGRVRQLSPELGGRTPAVALTAYSRAEDRTRVLMAGFNSHVPKPVEPLELLAVVRSLSRECS